MTLAPATFRGVPFAVTQTDFIGGRRQALHTYPGKDTAWPEDMGRAARRFRLRGFVLDGSRKLGGTSIAMQRQQLITACEKKGSGTLVHPTLGSLTVSIYPYSISEGLDAENYSEVSLECVEDGGQTFPTVTAGQPTTNTTTTSGVTVTRTSSPAASRLKAALIQQAKTIVATLMAGGKLSTSGLLANATGLLSAAGVRTDLVGSIAGWTAKVIRFAEDATALFRVAAVLPAASGTTNGRYSAGNNVGLTGSTASPFASDTTVQDLISDGSVLRGLVATAAAGANSTAAQIDLSDISDLASQIVAMIDALLDCCADPADAIRILLQLIASTIPGTGTTVSTVVDMMIWQAAAAALTNAVAAYQPTSTNDAAARIAQIGPVLDTLSVAAADVDAQDVYTALRDSRAAIVASLRAAAATTADLTAYAFGQPLPALVLAQQLYGDAARVDQLVGQVDPANPLFFPLSFQALSA